MEVITSYEPFSQEPEYISANSGLIDELPLDSANVVLDLACGTSLLTDLALEANPNLKICGVDLSEESLEIGCRMLQNKGIDAALVETMGRPLDFPSKVSLIHHSADDLLFDEGSFDLAFMGNAIHLMPDKDRFLREVYKVLRPGGVFAFNSVFFVGTFADNTEPVYMEWMKQALGVLNEINEKRMGQGQTPIPRKRGTSGKAFDKGWMTPEQWEAALSQNGFTLVKTYKREVPITRRGLELVGAYGGLASVLMSGYPVDVASECLQIGAGRAFDVLGISEVPRYWLEVTAKKQ